MKKKKLKTEEIKVKYIYQHDEEKMQRALEFLADHFWKNYGKIIERAEQKVIHTLVKK